MISVAEMRGLISLWGKGKWVIGIFDKESNFLSKVEGRRKEVGVLKIKKNSKGMNRSPKDKSISRFEQEGGDKGHQT